MSGKIELTVKYDNRGSKNIDVKDHVKNILGRSDYDSGKLEDIERYVENVAEFNGKLLELLISKLNLTVGELNELLDDYDSKVTGIIRATV